MACSAAWPVAAAFAVLQVAASSAIAAGGAHIVDDAGVETPGSCHLETWLSRHGSGSGSFNLAPACTLNALPQVEFGAAVERTWHSGTDTIAGPALKINLRPLDSGLGLGLVGRAAWSLPAAEFDSVSLIAPVSLRLSEQLRANFNVGWVHTPDSDQADRAFIGAQIEADLTDSLMAMGEVFTQGEGHIGGQLGLRWSPVPGTISLDLLTGWSTETASPWTVTIGMTIRR